MHSGGNEWSSIGGGRIKKEKGERKEIIETKHGEASQRSGLPMHEWF